MGALCSADKGACRPCVFRVVCTNGKNTWENEAHCDLESAIEAAKGEPGSIAYEFKGGKPKVIGKVTAAWVEDQEHRMVWPHLT